MNSHVGIVPFLNEAISGLTYLVTNNIIII